MTENRRQCADCGIWLNAEFILNGGVCATCYVIRKLKKQKLVENAPQAKIFENPPAPKARGYKALFETIKALKRGLSSSPIKSDVPHSDDLGKDYFNASKGYGKDPVGSCECTSSTCDVCGRKLDQHIAILICDICFKSARGGVVRNLSEVTNPLEEVY